MSEINIYIYIYVGGTVTIDGIVTEDFFLSHPPALSSSPPAPRALPGVRPSFSRLSTSA